MKREVVLTGSCWHLPRGKGGEGAEWLAGTEVTDHAIGTEPESIKLLSRKVKNLRLLK